MMNSVNDFCHPIMYQVPSTGEDFTGDQLRHLVLKSTNEYKSIIDNSDTTIKREYKEIVKLERIQNERWYMQYRVHSKYFRKRLNTDTEKRLYHGCPKVATNAIVHDGFNRSYAGVNGMYLLRSNNRFDM